MRLSGMAILGSCALLWIVNARAVAEPPPALAQPAPETAWRTLPSKFINGEVLLEAKVNGVNTWLLLDTGLRARMAEEGRRTALRYAWPAVGRRLETVFMQAREVTG